jgi:hypothetical protein
MNYQSIASKFLKDAIEVYKSSNYLESSTVDLTIAGLAIRIQASSTALFEFIYPAFAWQAKTLISNADLEIFIMEDAGDLISPWKKNDFLSGNMIRGLNKGNVLATFDHQHSILSIYDHETGKALFWVGSAANLPEWEFGAPLRNILTWSLAKRNIHLIHASGVGTGGSGVLIAGPGGSGKSTTTAISVASGLETTGDDYCAIEISETPTIHGVYGLLKLVPDSLAAPDMKNLVSGKIRSDGKAHYKIGENLKPSLRLTSVIFTHVSDATKEIKNLSSRDSLIRLVSSTMSQAALPNPEIFSALSELAQSVQAYEWEVGPDTEKIVDTLKNLCSS